MNGRTTLESLIERDGEIICIVRDIYEINPPECEKCVLRKVCNMKLSEIQLDAVIDRINRNIFTREFYESLNEYYDDSTYSEV